MGHYNEPKEEDTSSTISVDLSITGDLDMNSNTITNLSSPVDESDVATKAYVDKTVAESGLLSILQAATSTYVDAFINENADCFYSIDRGNEVYLQKRSKKIKRLVDRTLSNLDAIQSVESERPILSTSKNAKRFFMKFDGNNDKLISDINLNPQGAAKDIVNIFILFRLASFTGSYANFRNGLFGHDDGGWDKFVCFKDNGNLVISGVQGKDFEEIGNYPPKADLSVLNEWHCLSIHWIVTNSSQPVSSCWVNGKKLQNFAASSSPGANTMVFGDINPTTTIPLHGDVQLFVLFKGKELSDHVIKAHHKMICERYGVDHEKITFGE